VSYKSLLLASLWLSKDLGCFRRSSLHQPLSMCDESTTVAPQVEVRFSSPTHSADPPIDHVRHIRSKQPACHRQGIGMGPAVNCSRWRPASASATTPRRSLRPPPPAPPPDAEVVYIIDESQRKMDGPPRTFRRINDSADRLDCVTSGRLVIEQRTVLIRTVRASIPG